MKGDGKHIHLVGVCGVAMGSLAGMLKERGFRVTGSDERAYPPMSDMLSAWGVPVMEGYSAANVSSPDLVVIGNAVSRGNPEVEYVLDGGIPYTSMAQALRDFFLEGKEVIAVAGTHGKTTTTALLAHILETAGLAPSFFVGGVPRGHGASFKLGTGSCFVVEGDEYDSAFFEKVPKFIIYRPRHLVLTSLEFDHADIYRDLDEIELWFRRLVNIVPARGRVVYSAGYPRLAGVTAACRSACLSYGKERGDVAWRLSGSDGEYCRINLLREGREPLALETRLFGDFSFDNIAAAAAMALSLGVDGDSIRAAVSTFEGVKRRQELLYSGGGVRVYEDFAHHPTAVRSVLSAMRGRFPGARLVAVYEPRSATSRRRVHQEELPGAFSAADTVLIKNPYRLEAVPGNERIDIDRVVASLREAGKDAVLLGRVEEMVDRVFAGMDRKRENVVVIMSNGGFDGIYGKMVAAAAEFSGRGGAPA